MGWIYLFLAGLFEVGWPVGMKLAQSPQHRISGILFSLFCLGCSGFLLWMAQKTIPMGTAYAVWTGIGTLGAFVLGVAFFDDPQTALRWVGASLIVLGTLLLKLGTIEAR